MNVCWQKSENIDRVKTKEKNYPWIRFFKIYLFKIVLNWKKKSYFVPLEVIYGLFLQHVYAIKTGSYQTGPQKKMGLNTMAPTWDHQYSRNMELGLQGPSRLTSVFSGSAVWNGSCSSQSWIKLHGFPIGRYTAVSNSESQWMDQWHLPFGRYAVLLVIEPPVHSVHVSFLTVGQG